MRIEVGVRSDIGRVREGNEDSYLIDPPLFAVADGMGGHQGGEVASQMALETIEELYRAGTGSLADQVREANQAVFAAAQQDQAVTGMGTTLTAVMIGDAGVQLAHVGDSRAYLLRVGQMRQLTSDHTLVGRMIEAGEITPAEAEVHPHRNVLTRALGTEPVVEVDEELVALMDGDRLLLCSDGLFGMVAEDQIQAICEAEPDPQKVADRLIKAANRAGGVDNITVVVLDAHDDGTVTPRAPGAPEPIEYTSGERALREHAPTIRRWVAGSIVAIVVLAGVLALVRGQIDNQWYVGESDGKVAIFQGIPAAPLGYELHSVTEVTEVSAADAQELELYADLDEGISANSRSEADAIVEQIRLDVEAAAKGNG